MIRVMSAVAAAALLGVLANAPADAARSPTGTNPPQANATGRANTTQSANEADAKARCGSDSVVWVNTKSRVYHLEGSSPFGHTKHGAFMCRADADKTGRCHVAKGEAAHANAGRNNPPVRSGSPPAPR